MKLQTTKTAMLAAVSAASKVISQKNAMPICECVKVWHDEGTDAWWVTGGTPEMQATVALQVTDCDSAETMYIPAQKLVQTLMALPDAPITLEGKDSQALVRCGKGRYKMPVMQTDEYPQIQPVGSDNTEVVVAGSTFVQAVKAALTARAEDELRPQMGGVFLDVKGDGMTIVASDGHRMYNYTTEVRHDGGGDMQVILSGEMARLVDVLFRGAGEVHVVSDDRRLMLWTDGVSLVAPNLEGRYPNYRSVIPDLTQCQHITVNVKEMVAALQRADIFASEASHLVAIGIKGGQMTIEAEDIDFNRGATEEVAVMDTDCHDGFRIGAHIGHLVKLLRNVKTDNVVLHVSAVNRPIVMLEDGGSSPMLALLMPMLLNQ